MRFDRSYSEKCGAVRYGVTFRAKLLPQTLCYYLTLCDNWIHISIVINGTEFAFPLLSMWKSLLWMHTFCFRLCRFRSGTGLRQRVSSREYGELEQWPRRVAKRKAIICQSTGRWWGEAATITHGASMPSPRFTSAFTILCF